MITLSNRYHINSNHTYKQQNRLRILSSYFELEIYSNACIHMSLIVAQKEVICAVQTPTRTLVYRAKTPRKGPNPTILNRRHARDKHGKPIKANQSYRHGLFGFEDFLSPSRRMMISLASSFLSLTMLAYIFIFQTRYPIN